MTAHTVSAAELLERLIATPVESRVRVLEQAAGEPGANLASIIEHAGKMALADPVKANAATDVLVNVADRMGTQLDRARARRARARALSYAGKFRDALFVCDEGIRLAEEAGSAIEAARARLASMHALGELGRLDEAIAEGEAAREAFLSAGESSLAARADLNIGTAHQRRDDPATALNCFDRARPLLLSEPMILGPLDNNRGEALLAINDFAGAEMAFTSALQTFRQTRANLAEAIVEGNLADLAARQGQLQSALLHFEHARRALEGSGNGGGPHLARLLAEQAEAMAMLGMPDEALTEYEKALAQLDAQGLALEAARARSGMGLTLLRLKRYAAAETALAAAAIAFDELGHITARARVDLLRAELAAINGRAGDAQSMALRALAALHDRPADAAVARLLLGRLARQAGSFDQALGELNVALSLAQQLDLAPLQADVLSERGRLHRARGLFDHAVTDLCEAVAQVERIRGTLQADRFRAAFLGERATIYEELAATALERHDVPNASDLSLAFSVIEQARSRLLLEQVQRDLHRHERAGDGGATDQAEAALLGRLQRARHDLNALYSTLGDDKRRSEADERAWRQTVREREREVDEIESRLATTRGVGDLFASGIELGQVQQLIAPQSALVEYFTIADQIGAFVVRKDGVHVHRAIASSAELAKRLPALQFQINRALRPGAMEGPRGERLIADATRELAAIADAIWRPLASDFQSARHVIIIPHGVLHMVPFAALWTGDQWLAQRQTISAAPSATLLQRLIADSGRSEPDAFEQPLIVGVADESVPHVASEARAVAELLVSSQIDAADNALLLNDQATVERVRGLALGASLLHLACHGRYAPDSPLGSGVRLADRWLTVRDMLDLRLRARLVTLSGCETGLNSVRAGDELMGLLRGLFAAGACSILASLWRVDDSVTREWMTAFYGSLHTVDGPAGLARAVQDAHLSVMRTHPHPAFWAPFFLTGRP